MIQEKLICISLLLQISNQSQYDRKYNVHKTIRKNGSKEYNERYICCFFTMWNLLSAIMYKCGRVVLFLTSVYLPSSNSYCYFHILFMYHALYVPTFIFRLYVLCFNFLLIDHNQKQVLLIKWVIFFFLEAQKYFFALQIFENGHIHKVA